MAPIARQGEPQVFARLDGEIYTKTGDDGTTGFLGNRRVPKDDVRIEAYGTIDELNSVLGVARAREWIRHGSSGRPAPGRAFRPRLGPG